MPKPTITQTNFTGGEMSRSMFGRTDISKYASGLQLCRNYSIKTRGTAESRPGTTFVGNAGGAVRLLPFTSARGESYVVALGGGEANFYRAGGQVFGPIAIPYADADIPDIQHAQSVDVMWLVHPDYPIQELQRTGVDVFSIVQFDSNGPFGVNNHKDGNDYPSVTLSIQSDSPDKAVASSPIFTADDVGVTFMAQDDITGDFGSWKIIGFTSVHTVEIEPVTVNDPASYGIASVWKFPDWSASRGYPAAVGLHQQRLWFGGSSASPQTIWGSRISDFNQFRPFDVDNQVLDDSSIQLSIDSDVGDSIQWILPSQRGLLMGTEFGEHILRGDAGSPITPTSVTVLRQSTHGSRQGVRPIQTSRGVLYAHHTGLRVMELFYSIQSDGYISRDLTLLSDHVCAGLIKEMSWGRDPDNKLVVVMEDGSLWLCTYDSDQEVIAWHQYNLGGNIMSCAYAREDGDDILHALVVRDGNTYIERFARFGTQGDAILTPIPLDSSLGYFGASTTTLSGLSHLEGQEVYVVDNSLLPDAMQYQGPYTVTSGSITLDEPVTDAVVGLQFTCELVTMPIQPLSLGIDVHSRKKSIARIHANVQGGMFGRASQYGCTYDTLDEMASEDNGGWKKHQRRYDIVETAVEGTFAQLVSAGIICDRPVHSSISALSYEISVHQPE